MILCVAALVTSAFVAGCSSPCDALADTCKRCNDSNTVATYRAVPVSGNSGCQAVLDAKTFDSCK
jgi:hypothetical protein